jgi:hypothetical protein
MLGPSCRWLPSAFAALAIAGCGQSSEKPAHPARAAATPKPAAAGPCRAAVGAAVSGSGVRTRVTDATPGQATCVYTAPRLRVDVTVDSNPQAQFRFDRAVVERGQNAVWSHTMKASMPRLLNRLGVGADWFPAEHQLLTTDGKRLITVEVVKGKARLRLARRVARAELAAGGGDGGS